MEQSMPFNNGQWYSAEEWALYFSSLVSSGVNISESLSSLSVEKLGWMSVRLSDGKANIKGYYYEATGGHELTVSQTTAQGRIDRVILRLNLNQGQQGISAVIKEGTPTAPPALQRDISIWELSLASITIPANSNNLTNAVITDERANADVCGIMSFLGNQQFQQPTGSIIWYALETPPPGYLFCNGGAVSRLTYKTLFDIIGIKYGVGDGSTTFNLPDLRSEFIRGWDNGRGIDPGREMGSSQDGTTFFEHPWRSSALSSGEEEKTPGTMKVGHPSSYGGSDTNYFFKTRPRNIALLPCIKY